MVRVGHISVKRGSKAGLKQTPITQDVISSKSEGRGRERIARVKRQEAAEQGRPRSKTQ